LESGEPASGQEVNCRLLSVDQSAADLIEHSLQTVADSLAAEWRGPVMKNSSSLRKREEKRGTDSSAEAGSVPGRWAR